MKRNNIRSCAIALAVIMGLAGCGPNTGTVVSESQTSMLPSHDETPGLIYGKPARKAIPAAAPLSSLQTGNAWYNVNMPNATDGYRFGYINGKFALQRTETAGKEWYSIVLPRIVEQMSPGVEGGEIENPSLQVLGASQLYLYAMMPSGTLVSARSVDAGQNWTVRQAPLRDGQGLQLSSISQLSGADAWILVRRPNATQQMYRLFHVQSHGATVLEQQVKLGAVHAGLPGQSTSAAVAFTNATTGWIVATTSRGQLLFYTTVDGGNRWTSRILKGPAVLRAWRATHVFQPRILEHEGTFAVVYTRLSNGQPIRKTVVFRSRDGGANVTGEVVDKLDDAMADYSGSPTYFTNTDYGYSIQDGRLVRSTDSGTTWRTIHSSTLEWQLRQYPCVLAMDYVSDPVGFILLGSRNHRQSVLLQTTDESSTWRVVHS